MSKLDLNALEAAAIAATPDPERGSYAGQAALDQLPTALRDGPRLPLNWTWDAPGVLHVTDADGQRLATMGDRDAWLFIHSANSVLALVARIRELEAQDEIRSSNPHNPNSVAVHVFKRCQEACDVLGAKSLGELVPAVKAQAERIRELEAALGGYDHLRRSLELLYLKVSGDQVEPETILTAIADMLERAKVRS